MAIKSFDATVPAARTYKSRYAEDIRQFLKSGSDCAEVEVPAGASAKSVAVGYLMAIKARDAFRFYVRVARRGDRVYLHRIPEIPKEENEC